MKSTLPPLGDLEHELLNILWEHGELTALEIGGKVARKLKDATIRTVLRRLEEKGYVSHTVDGRTYVFSATEARPQVAARAVKRIVDWLCNGSVDEVLVGMVDARMLDRRTLQRLAKRIEDAKGGK